MCVLTLVLTTVAFKYVMTTTRMPWMSYVIMMDDATYFVMFLHAFVMLSIYIVANMYDPDHLYDNCAFGVLVVSWG